MTITDAAPVFDSRYLPHDRGAQFDFADIASFKFLNGVQCRTGGESLVETKDYLQARPVGFGNDLADKSIKTVVGSTVAGA